jgi:hypothetical protein
MASEATRKKLEEIVSNIPSIEELARMQQQLVFDTKPADKGVIRSQDDWVKYWNKPENNLGGKKWFPSFPDFYLWLKQVKRTGKQKSFLDKLKSETRKNHSLHFSTRLKLELKMGSVIADVTHHYNFRSTPESRVELPIFPLNLDQLLQNAEGRKYFSAILATKDSPATILDTFSQIEAPDKFKVLTQSPNEVDFALGDPRRSINIGYNRVLHTYYLTIASQTLLAQSYGMSYL